VAPTTITSTYQEGRMTLDQMFESFRRASVSSLQMQQDMFKQWTQQWPIGQNGTGISPEWMQTLQKRWVQFTLESLNRHRELLDSMYKSLIQVVEQASHLSESKSPEEYRRTTEDLRHKMFETFKDQSEAQLREFQKSAERWFDVMPKA
jgi:hypothetical protein